MNMRLLILAAALMLSASQPAFAQSAFNDPGTEILGPNGQVGGLVAVEPKVEAGTIDPGTNNSLIVQFRNESGADIDFKDVKLFPSSNVTATVMSDQCSSEPLQSGAQCAVVMQVKGLQSGEFRVEVLARHSGRSRLVTATVAGTVAESDATKATASDIEVKPDIVDFGKLEASRPIIRSITLRNITSGEITINDLFIDAPESSGFSLKTDCKKLVAGASCIASIVWSPITKGPTSGALVIQHNGPTGVATVNITGEFLPTETTAAKNFPEAVPGKGLLVASEEEIDFGGSIDSLSSITVSLVNIGDAPLTLTKLELSGSEQGLKLQHDGCVEDLELAPTEACALTVVWSPSKAGAVTDAVKISHDGARGILVLPIKGTSVASVNVDAKPVMSVIETITTPEGNTTTVTTTPSMEDTTPPVLDGYSVSSLARKNAIINGPGGSRMVRDGQTVRIAGHEWIVSVTSDGVAMTSGKNKVLLVFDRSLSAPVSSDDSGSSSSSSTPTPSTSTTAAPSAAPTTGQ